MAYWIHLSHPTRQIRLNANRMFIDEGFIVFQQCQEGGSEYHDDPRRVAAFPANMVDAVYDSDFVERAENIPSLPVGSRIPIETAQHRQETDAERIQRTAAPAVQRAMPQRYPQLTEAEAVPQAYQDPRSSNPVTPEPSRFVASWEEQPIPEAIASVRTSNGTLTGQAAIDYLSIDRNNHPAWQAEVAAREQDGINMIHVGTPRAVPETDNNHSWRAEVEAIRSDGPVSFRGITPYPITGGQAIQERSY